MTKAIISQIIALFMLLIIFIVSMFCVNIYIDKHKKTEIPKKNEEKFKSAISQNLREEQKNEEDEVQKTVNEVVYTAQTVRTQSEEMMRADNLNFRGDAEKLSYKPGEYRRYRDFEGNPMWLSPQVKSLRIFEYGETYTIDGELYTVTPDVSNCSPEPCVEILKEGENTLNNVEIYREGIWSIW